MIVNLWSFLEFIWKLLKLEFRWKKPKLMVVEERCVLIVEDDLLDAEILQNYLLRCGCTFDHAMMSEVAQQMLKTKFYKLAFVDLRLPTMPGQRLISEIKRHQPHTYIVAVSGGDGGWNDISTGVHIGFIKKNVSLEAIEEVVRLVYGDVKRSD